MSDCRKCAEFDWCVENEDCGLFKPKPLTNYDHIVSKTPEELANWLSTVIVGGVRNSAMPSFPLDNRSFCERWLDWLKQEVAE